ncbi:MAG: hypothetical protein K0R11_2040, partial [Acidimicrobiales bacterium]|nr:hypothetical protein [Acidimicrobiales bacterium]
MTSSSSSPRAEGLTPLADRALRLAEEVLYLLACVLLLAGAVSLLVKAGYDLATNLGDEGVTDVASGVL